MGALKREESQLDNSCLYYSKAGIASPESKEQLIIALEPEGGAIFCRERKMRDFADQTGDASVSDVLGRPGQRYVMMDIGGRAYLSSQKLLVNCKAPGPCNVYV